MNSAGATTTSHPARTRRWVGVGAVLVALLGAFLLVTETPLTVLSYDLAYLVRRPEVPPEAILVLMDESSHRNEGQQLLQPWDRQRHAQLIQRLAAHSPRAIVLDAYLPATNDSKADSALVEAARAYGRVAVAANMARNEEIGAPGGGIRPPFSPLREVVRWGPAQTASRGVVREVFGGSSANPSLPEQVARMTREAVDVRHPYTQTPDHRPDTGRRYLRYYGPPGTFTAFSYSDVLAGRIPGNLFSNVVVFVGAAYKGPPLAGGRNLETVRGDNLETPYHRWTGELSTGVEVVATASVNEMRGDALHRLGPWTEVVGVLGTGVIGTLLISAFRPALGAAVAVGLALLLAGLGTIGVWWSGIWIPWLVPVVVQLPLALAWCTVVSQERPQTVATADRTPASVASEVDLPAWAGLGTAQTSKTEATRTSHSFGMPGIPPGFPPPPPARMVAEHTLLRVIGRGGYGEVWLARNTLGELRAIKIVDRHSFADARPFERELEGIRKFSPLSLKHPGLVPVLHVGRDDAEGRFHYVMEVADDESGRRDVEAAQYRPRTLDGELRRSGPLRAAEVLKVGLGIGEALAYLHSQGLVHRDVKPGNILFIDDRPKLADVGLVTAMAETGREVSQVGTLGYVPPEGVGTVQADVFALGKLLYVALTGQPAKGFPNLPTDVDHRPDATAIFALNDLLLRACDPDPGERFTTMAEFLDGLRAVRMEQSGPDGAPV